VQGGGVEQPRPTCVITVKLCILYDTPSPSNTLHYNAGEPLAYFAETTTVRRWILIQRERTGSGF
jgi:hypothetical protein